MGPLLLRATVDTLIVRQVSPVRSSFENLVFVSAGVAQVVTLVVVILLAIIFFRMWKAQIAIQEQLARLSSKVDPMIASATAAAENVRVLTDAVKSDAVEAAEALTEATGRVRDSVSGIADRIDEFGDLMGRVTDKAEAVADVAGAAITTIKAGSRLFKKRPPPRDRGHEARRARDVADDGAFDEALDEPVRLTDDGGHDSPYAEGSAASPRSPSRKRRRHRRRPGGSGGGSSAGGGSPASPS